MPISSISATVSFAAASGRQSTTKSTSSSSARLAAESLRFSGAMLFTARSLAWSRRSRISSPVVPDSPSTKTTGILVDTGLAVLPCGLVSASVMANSLGSNIALFRGNQSRGMASHLGRRRHRLAVVQVRPQRDHAPGDLLRRGVGLNTERVRDRDVILVGLVVIE